MRKQIGMLFTYLLHSLLNEKMAMMYGVIQILYSRMAIHITIIIWQCFSEYGTQSSNMAKHE